MQPLIAETDFGHLPGDRIGAMILDAQAQKVLYMLVIGDKEAGAAALRLRSGADLGAISVEQFITRTKREIEKGD